MYFDTHCHLYDEQFKEDIEETIKRAQDGGVLNMLVLGDKIETSKQQAQLSPLGATHGHVASRRSADLVLQMLHMENPGLA